MSIPNMTRAAFIALSLTAGGFGATVPVQAASTLSFEFSFGNQYDDYQYRDRYRRCLSDEGVIRLVRSEGFRNLDFRSPSGPEIVRLRATKGYWIYSITVDRCPGRIVEVDRLRRR